MGDNMYVDYAVVPQSEDGVQDESTVEPSSTKSSTREGQECATTEATKHLTGVATHTAPVKPGVAAPMVSTELKFRCSPKTRKAPPILTTGCASDTEVTLSADLDKTSERLAAKDGENDAKSCGTVLRDTSPCNKCTSASSSSSTSNADSKPALKPKPVAVIVREKPSDISVSHISHALSNCEPATTGSASAVATAPVYAAVNKSRKSTSNIGDGEVNANKPTTNVTVARSKSVVTPPKKPPRTFAHSEYMRLKSLNLPRRSSDPPCGSDGDVKTVPTDAVESTRTNEHNFDAGCKVMRDTRESSEAETTSKECSFDDGRKEPGTKTKQDCFGGGGKVIRRQSDKLPAPPRPPPPSFPDNRSSTLSSVWSCTVDVDAPTDNNDSRRRRSERLSLSMEEKQPITVRRQSASDALDDSDIYAVPGEVNSDAAKHSIDICHDATRARSRLTCTSSAASETTQLTVCPV